MSGRTNIAKAESNASLLAIAEAQQYIWRQPNIAEAGKRTNKTSLPIE